jgi:hypothetical protein
MSLNPLASASLKRRGKNSSGLAGQKRHNKAEDDDEPRVLLLLLKQGGAGKKYEFCVQCEACKKFGLHYITSVP